MSSVHWFHIHCENTRSVIPEARGKLFTSRDRLEGVLTAALDASGALGGVYWSLTRRL